MSRLVTLVRVGPNVVHVCVYVREEDNHSETLWANIDAGCYRNNGQTCRDNAMCHGARRVHYTPAAYTCVYTVVRVDFCARA